MGLIYQLPISEDERDFVTKKPEYIELKSYGLPVIFWFYLAASFAVYFFLVLAAIEPIKKMLSYESIDQIIAYSLSVFLFALPVCCLGFFFYLKRVKLTKESLSIIHSVFGIPLISKKYVFEELDYEINHYLESPNVARMYPETENRGFQNKGYFILNAKINQDKKIFIDRSSSKADLKKIIHLLQSN